MAQRAARGERDGLGGRDRRNRQGARIRELTPMDVVLSGSVEVSYAVRVVGSDGLEREVEAHVELPEDARSLLEAASWRDGTCILDVLSRIAVTCIARLEISKLLAHRTGRIGERVDARIRASLSDVRAVVAELARA
jgi:hypothetical protein